MVSVLLASVCVFASFNAEALYIFTTEDGTYAMTDTASIKDIQARQVVIGDRSANGTEIYLQAGQTVAIEYDGAAITATAKENETVAALLARLHVDVSPLEIVAIDESEKTLRISITSDLVYYEDINERCFYETKRVPNPLLPKGTENVIQPGINGTQVNTYEVVYADGAFVSRQLVDSTAHTSQTEIVEYGTAVSNVERSDRIAKVVKNDDGSGYLVMASGATMPFSGTMTAAGTAYTAGSGGVGTSTATGTAVHVGTVAVDRKLIPLGTRMYIVTNDGVYEYGVGVAEDTGVRGNHVDLYFNTYQECINFGRRTCTIYFLS